jgi:hypothetical protein
MNRLVLLGIIAGAIFLSESVGAKEIHLNAGETYRHGDLTVTCSQSSVDSPLALKDCQYWDDFNKKCLFEKTIFMYKNLECIEECQHWETFNSTCYYRTKCTFYPPQKSFVRTTCEKFDDFNKTCLRTRDTKIGR